MQKHIYHKYVSTDYFNIAVNISLQNNYLYVETPKVACSKIKSIIECIELGRNDVYEHKSRDLIHHRSHAPLLSPRQVFDLEKLITERKMYKFCFVRNPYTRILSAYLNKIEANEPEKYQILYQLGHPADLNIKLTFHEFVSAIYETPLAHLDPHWKHQYYLTYQDDIDYDYVGKIENFQKDFTSILKVINKRKLVFDLGSKINSTDTDKMMKKLYTREIRDMVYNKYRIDFDYFDYSPELSVFPGEKPKTCEMFVDKKVNEDYIGERYAALKEEMETINSTRPWKMYKKVRKTILKR